MGAEPLHRSRQTRHVTGTLDGKLHWQQDRRVAWPDEDEAFALQSNRFRDLEPEREHREQALRLERNGIRWLVRTDKRWFLDLDAMHRQFSKATDFPWFRGVVEVSPKIRAPRFAKDARQAGAAEGVSVIRSPDGWRPLPSPPARLRRTSPAPRPSGRFSTITRQSTPALPQRPPQPSAPSSTARFSRRAKTRRLRSSRPVCVRRTGRRAGVSRRKTRTLTASPAELCLRRS